MAVYGQGAAGVRIRLRDESEVSLVTNPNITAGIVGYAPKGELNKVIELTSTADESDYLGDGYNSYKYNQGLYAAHGILSNGGYVDYVRPYGETVITDKTSSEYDTNQALKTDTFTVAFDYSEADNNTSFDIHHYASTRYKEDGLSGYGTRKIYTIEDVLKYNTNVDFDLSADAMEDAAGGTKKVMLFAIMNNDPSSAIRAGTKYTISSITVPEENEEDITYNETDRIYTAPYESTVITTVAHGLSVDDVIIITGTDNYNGTYTVSEIIDETSFKFVYTTQTNAIEGSFTSTLDMRAETSGYFYANTDVAEDDEVDYLKVTTVATGEASKKYDSISLNVSDLANVLTTDDDGKTLIAESSDGSDITFTFKETVSDSTTEIGIDHDTLKIKTINLVNYMYVSDSDNFSVGDKVIVQTSIDNGPQVSTIYTVNEINSVSDGTTSYSTLTLYASGAEFDISSASDTSDTDGVIITNLTGTLRNFQTVLENYDLNSVSYSTLATISNIATDGTLTLGTSESTDFDEDDLVMIEQPYSSTTYDVALESGLVAGTVYKVKSVSDLNDTITLESYNGTDLTLTAVDNISYRIVNLTETDPCSIVSSDGLTLDLLWKFGLSSPKSVQENDTSVFVDGTAISDTTSFISLQGKMDDDDHMIVTSGDTIIDSDIGKQFVNLGLATEDYADTDFDGEEDKVYVLTDDGEIIAKMYVYVTYYFNGDTYEFSGTLKEYVYNDTNLYLKDSAEDYENGWTLVMNDDESLVDAIESDDFDLTDSQEDGIITSSAEKVAYDETDPAILNNAIWEYEPSNNSTSDILSDAWQLFLDRDNASVDMLVSAGTAIKNLFVKGMEEINYDVMNTILDMCEKRKDMFAIFDGVDEKKIDVALKKMIKIGSDGTLARWGAIFDGRSIFEDTYYTKLNVPAVKTIEVAAIITANRSGNVYWLPPAGFAYGQIPSDFATRQKDPRTYNYGDDADSDIARLYDANINPTRVNSQGQFIWGQKTMLKRMTALNRLNVIMLIAGLHSNFEDYLDRKTFQLNTAALRNDIQTDLQAQLELIKAANPAGLTDGKIICDSTNNDSDIIDTNQLIVDMILEPSRSGEFITLRTTVKRTGADLTITNTTLGGE